MNLRKRKTKLEPRESIGKPSIVFLSSLSHRRCGIAKFTRDLMHSAKKLFGKEIGFKRVAVVNKNEINTPSIRGLFVYKIDKNQEEDYRKCAKFLNGDDSVKLVNVQHEFGIFGGEMGSYVLAFLKEIKKPVFVTFHTVIPKPSKELFSLVNKIGKRAKRIIVMTEKSRSVLLEKYCLPKSKISLIPHGIASFHYEDSNREIKKKFGLANKTLVFTHGFLSRNKGIEYVLESLPEVIKKYPRVIYLLAGRTHPNVKLQEGESYRHFLLNKVAGLGIQKNVRFVNKYITTRDLIDYLKACDIYISTSLDPHQAVSGTFAYALGSGRPVISTSFSHAKEELKKGMGVLVKPRDPGSYKKTLMTLLGNQKLSKSMGMNCYFKTRNMTWQNVALSYGRIFSGYVPNVQKTLILPPVMLAHCSG